jgi:thiol:disulfide interchange protein
MKLAAVIVVAACGSGDHCELAVHDAAGLAAVRAAAGAVHAPLLLHFTAEWCAACRVQDNQMPELASVVHVRIDVGSDDTLARRFGVGQLPTLIVVDGDRECTRVVGTIAEPVLAHVIASCASAAALTRSNVARSIAMTMSPGSSAYARAVALSSTQ